MKATEGVTSYRNLEKARAPLGTTHDKRASDSFLTFRVSGNKKGLFKLVALLGLIVKLLTLSIEFKEDNRMYMKSMTGKQERKARPRDNLEKDGKRCTSEGGVKRLKISASTRQGHTGSRPIVSGFRNSTGREHA